MLTTSTRLTVDVETSAPRGADVAVAFLPEKAKTLPADLPLRSGEARAALEAILAAGLFRGKAGEACIVPIVGRPLRAAALVGLGPADKLDDEARRRAGAAVVKLLRKHRLRHAAVVLPPDAAGDDAAAFACGLLLAAFRFDELKGTAAKRKKDADGEAGDDDRRQLRATIVTSAEGAAGAVRAASTIAEAQNFARTIAWRPGNQINPPALANVARSLAREVGLAIRILDEKTMARLGMGGILAVGAGSASTPPRLIVLEHRPRIRSRKATTYPVLVVGKAITFDTGGISIKPAEKMGKMIFDKCGAMAVLGLMAAAARLKLPVPVVGILAAAENHISDSAYRPGDVLRMYNGVTVEVTNTDAEGRLVLADALAWGIDTFKPAAVIDLATLTGGVVVALGRTMAGLMSNDDALAAEVQAAAGRAGEKLWRLPLGDEQREQIKSDPADIVNSAGRDAHPLQGGAFLSHFVPDGTPWAHLDIAGVADTEKELPYYAKGPTGWGVRTLVELVSRRADRI